MDIEIDFDDREAQRHRRRASRNRRTNEKSGHEITAKNLVLGAGRNGPVKIVTSVEFGSWESARQNNQLGEIQETGEDPQENNGATYRNDEVHRQIISSSRSTSSLGYRNEKARDSSVYELSHCVDSGAAYPTSSCRA